MPSLPEPQILDVTVRDGSYLINHQYTPEMVSDIAKGLFEAGISYAEVSHGCGIGAKQLGFPARVDDQDLMEAAKQSAPDLKLSAFCSLSHLTLPLLPALVDYFDMGRVGTNVTEVEKGKKIIEKLKKYGKTVSLQLVRTHGTSPEGAGEAARIAADMGADIIYVVDSFGSMMPGDVVNYLSAVKSHGKVEVGFHGHNNIQMAIPNTLAAWEAGATWLDGSLMGVGRATGNANLEILAYILQSQGLKKEIDLEKLCTLTWECIIPIFKFPPLITFTDLLLSLERLDYPQQEILPVFASLLNISLEDFLLQLHHKVGQGVEMGEAHIEAVFQDVGVDFKAVKASLNSDKQ